MLKSQNSSCSLSSAPSLRYGDVNYPKELPQKFKDSCVLSRKFSGFNEEPLVIIITNLFELIECCDSVVVNYINLSSYFSEFEKVTSSDIEFDPIFQGTSTFLFLLKIKASLFGIERCTSQLKFLSVINQVKSFKQVIDDSGRISVEVTLADRTKKLTSFLDDDFDDVINNSTKFSALFESVKHKSEIAEAQLNSVISDIEQLDALIYGSSKMLPKLMTEDVRSFNLLPCIRNLIFLISFQGS